jgi:hypothetical protein
MAIHVYNGCINEPVTKASTAFHSRFITFLMHINKQDTLSSTLKKVFAGEKAASFL